MVLRFKKQDGNIVDIELDDRPITIGRSKEADIIIPDDKASRIHCGIRLWEGRYYLKDLKSRNGTYVNEQLVEVVTLNSGDQVRIGDTIFLFLDEVDGNAEVALQEVEKKMADGKGYGTILQEIVGDMNGETHRRHSSGRKSKR